MVTFHIHIQRLKNWPEDIIPLALHYMYIICCRCGAEPKELSADYRKALSVHSWPGNVRELKNVLNAGIVSAGSEPVLYPHHLPPDIKAGFIKRSIKSGPDHSVKDIPAMDYPNIIMPSDFDKFPTFRKFREENIRQIESVYLDCLIALSQGNTSYAMKHAGLSRPRLYELLKKHGKQLR